MHDVNVSSGIESIFNVVTTFPLLNNLGLRESKPENWVRSYDFLFFFCLFVFSRTAPTAYGGSQAKGHIGAIAAGPCQSHSNMGSKPCLQSTSQLTYGNARSLTHWARPGIEPTTSRFLVGFVNHRATTGTPEVMTFYCDYSNSALNSLLPGLKHII